MNKIRKKYIKERIEYLEAGCCKECSKELCPICAERITKLKKELKNG